MNVMEEALERATNGEPVYIPLWFVRETLEGKEPMDDR